MTTEFSLPSYGVSQATFYLKNTGMIDGEKKKKAIKPQGAVRPQ